MCNIAGYAGTRPAAPILIDLIRRQEGFAGGFFTGIATVHEGKIHYAKLAGDTDRLVSLTEAANLPGTVGIIHSRSKGVGGDAWAHPFLDAEERIAYVANGTRGIFKNSDMNAFAQAVADAGYAMSTRTFGDAGHYPVLSDGSTVHISDVVCQMIARNMDAGADAREAMERAFCEFPSQIVGLMLSLTEPDTVIWSRIDHPMHVAFAPHGAYLSSSPTVFPADAGEYHCLPALSSGRVTKDGFSARPYRDPPCTVAPIDARTVAEGYAAVCARLDGGECAVGDLSKAVRPCFSEAQCVPDGALIYGILRSLLEAGKIRAEIRRRPGVREDLTAPKTYFIKTEDEK